MRIDEIISPQELEEIDWKKIGKGAAAAGLATTMALGPAMGMAGNKADDAWTNSFAGKPVATQPAKTMSSSSVNDQAYDLASKMGISGSKLQIKAIGNVPVKINGKDVPQELYSPQQLQSIKFAKQAQGWMNPSKPAKTTKAKTPHDDGTGSYTRSIGDDW